jgi:hypothetical protein
MRFEFRVPAGPSELFTTVPHALVGTPTAVKTPAGRRVATVVAVRVVDNGALLITVEYATPEAPSPSAN